MEQNLLRKRSFLAPAPLEASDLSGLQLSAALQGNIKKQLQLCEPAVWSVSETGPDSHSGFYGASLFFISHFTNPFRLCAA